MTERRTTSKLPLLLEELFYGAGSAAAAKTLTAPLKRIQLILQTQKLLIMEDNKPYQGFSDAYFRIRREQGFISFWRGNGIDVIKAIPTTMLKFLSYDFFKRYFKSTSNQQSGVETLLKNTACGFLSSFVTITLAYPMDVMQTRVATDLSKRNQERAYASFFNGIKKVIRTEGVKSVYKGYWITIFGAVPHTALSFAGYDFIKARTMNDQSDSSAALAVRMFGAGTIASFFAQMVTYPFDTIRRRLQTNGALGADKLYRGTLDCLGKMARTEGLKSFYLGFWPHVLHTIAVASIQFSSYDFLKFQVVESKYIY